MFWYTNDKHPKTTSAFKTTMIFAQPMLVASARFQTKISSEKSKARV
jgi:hypothetical protein